MKCYSFLVFLGWTCSGVGSVNTKTMELRFVTERTLTRFSGPLWRCFRYNSTSPLHSLHYFLYTNTFYNLISHNNNNNTALLPLTIQATFRTYGMPLLIERLSYWSKCLRAILLSYFYLDRDAPGRNRRRLHSNLGGDKHCLETFGGISQQLQECYGILPQDRPRLHHVI